MLIFWFLSLITITTSYLTSIQWNHIQKIIQYNDTPSWIRNEINKIIYDSYEKWAINQAYEFKFLHKHKSKNIALEDYILSSKLGLYQSIQNYKGNSSFSQYSKIYIQGELYDCLTELYPLTNLPKNIRRKKKESLQGREKFCYKKRLNSVFVPCKESWRFDKIVYTNDDDDEKNIREIHHREKLMELWNRINEYFDLNSDLFSKKVFHYKYNVEFECIRSNKQIAELMGCSEEYVRRKLEASKKDLLLIFYP